MKKIFILYGALVVLVILLLVWRAGSFNLSFFGSQASATINNKKFSLSIADNEKERMKGLSGKKSLNQDDGMLFLFDKKDTYSFWMKNMNFPIDIIYLDGNRVVDVKNNVPPAKEDETPTIYTPSQPANRVLEVAAGVAKQNNIKPGSQISFEGVK